MVALGVIKSDQGLTRKCYNDSLKLKKKDQNDESIKDDHLQVNLVDIDPRENTRKDSLTPFEDVNIP